MIGSFFYYFRTWNKKIFSLSSFSFHVEVSKLYVSIKKFSEQVFFEKILFFNHNFGILFGSFPVFWQFFLPVLSKVQSLFLEEQFEEKHYSKANKNCSSFLTNGQKISRSLWSFFRLGLHNCILHVHWKYLRKNNGRSRFLYHSRALNGSFLV